MDKTTVDIGAVIKGSDSVVKIFDLGTFIGVVAGTLLTIAAVACFVYLVYGGLKWILAGGEKGKIEEAKQTITQSIIGLMVTAVAFALFAIIQYMLGVNIVSLGGEKNTDTEQSGSSDSSSNKKNAEEQGYNPETGHWDCFDWKERRVAHGDYACLDNGSISNCRLCYEGKYYTQSNKPKNASFDPSACPSNCSK